MGTLQAHSLHVHGFEVLQEFHAFAQTAILFCPFVVIWRGFGCFVAPRCLTSCKQQVTNSLFTVQAVAVTTTSLHYWSIQQNQQSR